MIIVNTREKLPTTMVKSIFLAGPTSRNPKDKSWREDAIAILEKLGYNGHVFTPEYRDNKEIDLGPDEEYKAQVQWEEDALNQADIIVFWIPREIKTLPGFTTNIEYGVWSDSGKVVLGYPKTAEKMRYLQHYAEKYNIPTSNSLEETLKLAVDKIGVGAMRLGGEAQVPLHIWKHPTFQGWLNSQKENSNELRHARVLWSFRPRYKDFVFCWVLQVHVYIAAEKREKINEFVLARTDISSAVLYYNPKSFFESKEDLLQTKVILVKEFRSPARTEDSFITELPSGSSSNPKLDQREVIVKELEEETSFKLNPNRFRFIGSRQLSGTFSAHISSLFSARLTSEEYDGLKKLADSGQVFGNIEDTEMTYIEAMSVQELLRSNRLDWSNIGMIFESLIMEQ
jgi:8-oxo-dGTP pyrophosphatase MutT (NUDIX family)/nucleoside 2-deoxyribosyltransferase